jgi:GTP diphosphokinase / guanosine-3',5'-bis(diphosphate) 3'-diphosphatase
MNKISFLSLSKESDRYSDEELNKFSKAIDFIEPILKNKKRLSGDSFFDHNLRVGIILVEIKALPEVVLAGLLHGLLDLKEEIVKLFSEDVYSLMAGAEEIHKIKFNNKRLTAEALRKVILTTLKDVRIIFVKLANKIDNLRSIEILPRTEQERIANEVLEIYAPLAYRLGIKKIKNDLEDLALKTLNPRKYNEIKNFLQESQEQREDYLQETVKLVKEISKDQVKIIQIKSRTKHVYSIYKKIVKKGIRLNDLYDLLGIRVLVKDEKDCYTLLGLLHQHFEPIPGRLKDYISNPKPNFYRSLHTAVILKDGKRLEVQIRTPEMNEYAEEGVAAHWRYKGLSSEDSFEKKMGWLKGILDLQKERGSKEFIESAKVDIFGDTIYCYTPKGDVKELPKDATLLDFAYAVHEEVGNKSVGGSVNGKFVPLRYPLKQGDVVEIVTNKNQRPRREWIKIVKSGKSRQKIRKSLKIYENLPAMFYRRIKPQVKEELGLLVESLDFPNAMCVLAKCCIPLPGEEIVGIITKRKLISVHKNDCRPAIKEKNRWVPVSWKDTFNQKIKFLIVAQERSGVLADLLNTIITAGFEVKEAKAKMVDRENVECSFLVIPRDLDHLIDLIKRIRKVIGVKRIYFE